MPKVSSLLSGRVVSVETVSPESTIHDAAVLMNEKRIGSVMVTRGDAVCGILTERDILTRIVAPAKCPNATTVGEVMTTDLLTCRSDTKLEEARQVMRDKRIRHLPVMDGDTLAGMISIGDLNMAQNEQLEQTIHHMEIYMHGGSM